MTITDINGYVKTDGVNEILRIMQEVSEENLDESANDETNLLHPIIHKYLNTLSK